MIPLENLIVQDKVKNFLQKAIKNNHLAHAYLFHGLAGTGKTAVALALAKTLNCSNPDTKPCNQCASCVKINNASHPDVKLVFPLSKSLKEEKTGELIRQKTRNPYQKLYIPGHLNIPIEAIRDLKKEAKYAPFEAQKRFFIITGIEFLSREAANSFLKLLEEPPENLVIILITNELNSVLDTIKSRCQPIAFPLFSEQEIKKIVEQTSEDDKDLSTLIRISQNNIEEVFRLLENDDEDMRPQVISFLRGAASDNWSEINKIIENLARTRDKNKAMEFVKLMILWVGDAFKFGVLKDHNLLINSDMNETIIKFADHYTELDYNKMLTILEEAIKDIKSNLNISLLFTKMALDIKNLLVGRINE